MNKAEFQKAFEEMVSEEQRTCGNKRPEKYFQKYPDGSYRLGSLETRAFDFKAGAESVIAKANLDRAKHFIDRAELRDQIEAQKAGGVVSLGISKTVKMFLNVATMTAQGPSDYMQKTSVMILNQGGNDE